MFKLIENEALPKDVVAEIISFTVSPPDDDGQVCPEIKYKVTNNSSYTCASLDINALVINGSGQIVHHYRESYDSELINPGETEELELGSYNFFPAIFGKDMERTTVLLKVTANHEISEVLDLVAVPNELFKTASVVSTKFSNTAHVSGSTWVEEVPAWFKGRRLQMRFVVQNKSLLNLQRFQFKSTVSDKAGKTVQSTYGSCDIAARAIETIESYMEFKDTKKLGSANLALELSALLPFAEGFAQRDSLVVE